MIIISPESGEYCLFTVRRKDRLGYFTLYLHNIYIYIYVKSKCHFVSHSLSKARARTIVIIRAKYVYTRARAWMRVYEFNANIVSATIYGSTGRVAG